MPQVSLQQGQRVQWNGGSVPYDDETSLQEFLKYLFSKVKEYMALGGISKMYCNAVYICSGKTDINYKKKQCGKR